jgi:3-methyladenine DNA glycosylase AlkD
MKSLSEVLEELRSLATEQTKKTYLRHGAPENCLGVKIGDMKPIAKSIRGCQALALELYDSGIPDAMYLAGLVMDGSRMTKPQLERWARQAAWPMVSEYSVPWNAAESNHAWTLGKHWISSKQEKLACTGWATLACYVAIRPDAELDIKALSDLLLNVTTDIHSSANRVRYSMNNFVIAVGCYVLPLTTQAKKAAKKIGEVNVDMGQTACQVPDALSYIEKVEARGAIGKKKKTIKC